MYKPTSFYLGIVASSTICFLFYPIIVSLVSFWMFGLDSHSFASFLEWTTILTMEATAGFAFGMMLGTIIDDSNAAISTNLLFGMLFSLGGGMYANTGESSNFLIKLIGWVSPMRYSSELLMRRILVDKKGAEMILHYFGYTWTQRNCYLAIIAFTTLSFIAGWVIIAFKYRNV